MVQMWLSWTPLEAWPYLQGYLGVMSQDVHLVPAFHFPCLALRGSKSIRNAM